MAIWAAVQMVSGPDVGKNLQVAHRLTDQAAQAGARVVVLPENFAFMGLNEASKLAVAERFGSGPVQDFMSGMARDLGVWVVGGTFALTTDEPGKVHAACLVYDAFGKRVGRYDKIHLFDVSLPNTDESYRESEAIVPGGQLVTLDTPWGRLGLAVCYDLRFPELFRLLQQQGMDVLALPAAFTATTGAAHWEVLLRARAIENQCAVVASGQGGHHANGRETYGHSCVIDGWGRILSQVPQSGEGVAWAEIDLEELKMTRERFPALSHRRFVSDCGSV